MARSKKAESALVFLLIVIGVPVWLFQNHPVLGVTLLVALGAGVPLYSLSRSCEVCGVALKRVAYRWQTDGKAKRVCPNCNRALERRQSARAVHNL